VSEENVEIVRQLIALGEQARGSGLTSLPTNLVTPDMEIDLSRRVFNPETYRGLDGWIRLNDELREVWTAWHVTPERILPWATGSFRLWLFAVAVGVAVLRPRPGTRRSGRSRTVE
jgi:hypothetical protein